MSSIQDSKQKTFYFFTKKNIPDESDFQFYEDNSQSLKEEEIEHQQQQQQQDQPLIHLNFSTLEVKFLLREFDQDFFVVKNSTVLKNPVYYKLLNISLHELETIINKMKESSEISNEQDNSNTMIHDNDINSEFNENVFKMKFSNVFHSMKECEFLYLFQLTYQQMYTIEEYLKSNDNLSCFILTEIEYFQDERDSNNKIIDFSVRMLFNEDRNNYRSLDIAIEGKELLAKAIKELDKENKST